MSRLFRLAAILVGLITTVGCVSDWTGMGSLNALLANLQHMAEQTGVVHGELVVRERDAPDERIVPRLCRSGEIQSFRGVDLFAGGHDPALLRVADDPIVGPRLRLDLSRRSAPLVLDRAHCRTLTSDVQHTAVSIGRVNLLAGSVVVDCTADDGTVVAGRLRFETCHASPDLNVAETNFPFARPGAEPEVPTATPPAMLPAALRALRVVAHTRVVGATAPAETPATAHAGCLASARSFVREVGWTLVMHNREPHDLDIEFACTGSVGYRTAGDITVLELPDAGGVSVTLRAAGSVVATLPTMARRWRCDAQGATPADRERDCAARLDQANTARLVGLIAASQPLVALADARERGQGDATRPPDANTSSAQALAR